MLAVMQCYNYSCSERRKDQLERAVSDLGTYNKGCLVESDKVWYHGELTRDKAEQSLKASDCDSFLIRHDQGDLVLSLIHGTKIDHTKINYGPGWYQLDGEQHPKFSELQELISHYCNNSIGAEVTLGTACEKRGEIKDRNTG